MTTDSTAKNEVDMDLIRLHDLLLDTLQMLKNGLITPGQWESFLKLTPSKRAELFSNGKPSSRLEKTFTVNIRMEDDITIEAPDPAQGMKISSMGLSLLWDVGSFANNKMLRGVTKGRIDKDLIRLCGLLGDTLMSLMGPQEDHLTFDQWESFLKLTPSKRAELFGNGQMDELGKEFDFKASFTCITSPPNPTQGIIGEVKVLLSLDILWDIGPYLRAHGE